MRRQESKAQVMLRAKNVKRRSDRSRIEAHKPQCLIHWSGEARSDEPVRSDRRKAVS